MGMKALREVLNEGSEKQTANVLQRITKPALSTTKSSAIFIRDPYLSLLSLLELSDDLKAGDKIGLFSYGSGSR